MNIKKLEVKIRLPESLWLQLRDFTIKRNEFIVDAIREKLVFETLRKQAEK